MALHITSQAELDTMIRNLREDGYPYLGSDDCVHTLLPDGRIMWQAPGPYGPGETAEDWRTVQTQEEFAESVFCWAHDC